MTVPWYFFVKVVILCYGKIMVSDAKYKGTWKNTMILKSCAMLFASLELPWYLGHVQWCFWKKQSIKTVHDFLHSSKETWENHEINLIFLKDKKHNEKQSNKSYCTHSLLIRFTTMCHIQNSF